MLTECRRVCGGGGGVGGCGVTAGLVCDAGTNRIRGSCECIWHWDLWSQELLRVDEKGRMVGGWGVGMVGMCSIRVLGLLAVLWL